MGDVTAIGLGEAALWVGRLGSGGGGGGGLQGLAVVQAWSPRGDLDRILAFSDLLKGKCHINIFWTAHSALVFFRGGGLCKNHKVANLCGCSSKLTDAIVLFTLFFLAKKNSSML